MRDLSLLIVTLGAILVSVCSSKTQSSDDYDEPVRMASESLVVKSYKDTESSTVSTTASLGERLEEYQVYQGVMGRPGIDFPVNSYIPATSFSCRGVKKSGYYADLATDCQVFHICDGNRKISFLCPNGTIFRQSHLICDWWFRVDCGKSVELYEESAEQLAADQKVYKARNEERERRRKYGKSLGENGGELTSSEVYALDEPFHIKSRQPSDQTQNNFDSSTSRASSARFEGRKGERNSKKVADSGITEKFPNYKENKQSGRVSEKVRTSKDRQGDARQYSTAAPITREPKVSFVSTQEYSATTPSYSTPSQKTRYQAQNNINFESNKENIQPAESGSLVEDLNNRERNRNFFDDGKKTNRISDNNARDRGSNAAYNGNQRTGNQGSDFNTRGRNVGVNFNENVKTDDGAFAYNKRTENQAGDFNSRGSNTDFAHNNNQKTTQPSDINRNYNFSYTDNRNAEFSAENKERNNEYINNENKKTNQDIGVNNKDRNNYFSYNTRTEEQAVNVNNGGRNSNSAFSANANQASDTGKNGNLAFNTNAGQVSNNGRTGNLAFNTNAGQASDTGRNGNLVFNTNAGQVSNNGRTGNSAFNTNAGQVSDTGKNSNSAFNTNAGQASDIGRNGNSAFNTNAGLASDTGRNGNLAFNTNAGQVSDTGRNGNSAFNTNAGQASDIGRTGNLAFNTNAGQASDTGRNGNLAFNTNAGQVSDTGRNGNSAFNTNANQAFDNGRNSNSAFNANAGQFSDTGRNGNSAFNTNAGQFSNTGRNSNSAFNTNAGQASDTGRNFAYFGNTQTENLSGQGVGVTDYTTEFVNYESKRTNPVERQETVTPTAQPSTRKTQSSRYRSSTPQYEEQEKQFFAETASFASNRGAKSFSDFRNQFEPYNKIALTTTTDLHKTTFYQTSTPTEGYSTTRTPPVQRFSSPIYNQNFNQPSTVDLFRTTTYRPVKQNSRKVTIFPSTNPQTTVTGGVWQTTTFPPPVETTTINNKFTVNDVYFTTSTPEREVEGATENFGLGQTQRDTEFQTGFNYVSSTQKPEVDITLQELNINKGLSQTEISDRGYEDLVREGLEVPPSSGPNALRSFALYFATTRNNGEGDEGKTTFVPVEEIEVKTTLTPFEIKKKEVVKQVDELVHKSSINISDHDVPHSDNALPNSLTPHTQDSYSALFAGLSSENHTDTTVSEKGYNTPSATEFETTAFESFTEEPHTINKELTKNDLDGSQSRGLVEPDPNSDTDYSKVSPDLRELAQVFTKALSAYLDDPEAFRRVLSEIRPTEPTLDSGVSSSNPIEYPSATQEDDEVLDFSDVTKASYKKKTSTATVFRETTTEFFTEPPTTSVNDIENLVLPQNFSSWATNIELTAPVFESLDQSQSSYYTPPSFIATTNAIAEAINNEFTGNEELPPSDSNETVDSYLPIRGSVDDPSLPRYGGFQNNTQPTTKYSPYGSELTSTTYLPYGADLTSTATPDAAATTINENKVTTFNPNNVTSFFSHFSKNDTQEGEIQLGKELNNLVLLQKFTTPRGIQKETTTPEPNLSTAYSVTQNDINQYQDVQLGNGEILETNSRVGKALNFPETDVNSNYFEPNPKEINLELSPPSSTPKGFLITYSLSSSSSERATYLPKATTPEIQPTTYSPGKDRITTFTFETHQPTSRVEFDNVPESNSRSVTEYFTTVPPTTISFSKSTPSIERLAQLQETLMFNTNNLTPQQKDQARVSVEQTVGTLNMTDFTTNTLMKMMEMAARNETYRRLVLLLVNDKSGKNRTVEEARLSLLKALLTPVINPHQTRTVVPIPELSKLDQPEFRSRGNFRRSKSISSDVTRNVVTTTPIATTTTNHRRANGKNVRRVKTNRGLARAESSYSKTGLGNLGVIRRTIENSKNKQVKINSVDDAILDSDSRAVELLKSLYSLAARWG